VREVGATSPESIAADIAAIIEKVTALAVAKIAKHGSQTVPGEPRYYTSTEAADYLRCCVDRIYNLSSQGRLKGRKDGGRLLFTREDLDGIVEASP
jgi:excisionase family DNA binding protein